MAGRLDPGSGDIWTEPTAVLLARLDTTPVGLDIVTAARHLAHYGPNDAAAEKHRLLVLQFMARCRPGRLLIGMTMGATALACASPFLRVGPWYGLVPSPPPLFAYLAGATAIYLAGVKVLFYRTFVRPTLAPP